MWNRLRDRTKTNIGFMDRVIRTICAVIIFVPVIMQLITGWVIIFPVLVSIYLLVTGNLGFSPAYKLFGYSTNK
jgi:uncharacterized membrane protein YhaH (DUF805 family)